MGREVHQLGVNCEKIRWYQEQFRGLVRERMFL
jgi:hypothetical protein